MTMIADTRSALGVWRRPADRAELVLWDDGRLTWYSQAGDERKVFNLAAWRGTTDATVLLEEADTRAAADGYLVVEWDEWAHLRRRVVA
jgi:hypothetical protein